MIIHIQKSLSFKFLRIIAKRTDFAQRNFYDVRLNQLLQVALGHWQWGFLYSGSVVQLVSWLVLKTKKSKLVLGVIIFYKHS